MFELTDDQKKLFYAGGVFKDYVMRFPDIDLAITNETIHQEAVTIKESIIEDEEFTLGGCIASSIEFEVSEIIDTDLNGLEFHVELSLVDRNVTIPMGTYRVNSAKRVDDKDYKRVIGYDALYDASADVSGWYASYFASGAKHTAKETREALLRHLNIQYIEQTLINDNVMLELTADTTANMPGTAVLKSLCSLNGGFGKINREGKFLVVYFGGTGLFPEETLYPEPTLYPEDYFANLSGEEDSPLYRETRYEEFDTLPITGLIIKSNDEDTGVTVGESAENPYIMRGNFLLYKKSAEELKTIASEIYAKIKDIVYRPNTTTLDGLPYVETGDSYILSKRTDIIESYVFSRTLEGVQGLKDTYESRGNQLLTNEVSMATEIQMLQSKTQEIEEFAEQTAEELEGVIEDFDEFKGETHVRLQKTEEGIEAEVARATKEEGNLSSRISMTSESIEAEVSRAKEAESALSSRITVTVQEIQLQVSASYENAKAYADSVGEEALEDVKDMLGDYPTKVEMQSSIQLTANSITSSVSATYETKSNASSNYTTLSSQITQTSNSITAEVTRASNAESSLSSRISITESGISSKVSKGDVSSEISQEAGRVTISSNRLVINSSQFTLDSNGNATFGGTLNAAGGSFSGNLSASTCKFIGLQSTMGNLQMFDTGTGTIYADYINVDEIYTPEVRYSAELSLHSQTRVRIYSGFTNTDGIAIDSNQSGKYHLRPGTNNTIDCGSTSYHWDNVYAKNGTIQTSDRNEKIDILDISEEYANALIDGSQPKSYRMKNGTSGRIHNGMIAQDLEEQLSYMGISTMDFAGFIKYEKEDEDGNLTGEYGYGIRYEEYIAPIIKYCQCLKRRVEILEKQVMKGETVW